MGGGKGSSAPPPPPDYSRQIAREQQRIEGRYRREADSYNQNVNRYNNLLGDTYDASNQLSNRISGLGVADATSENLSTFRDQVSELESNAPDPSIIGYDPTSSFKKESSSSKFGSIGEPPEYGYKSGNFVQGRPDFRNSIQHGTYGTIPLSPPSLSSPNQSLQQRTLGNAESIRNQLDGLKQERQQERESIRDFRNQMLGDADVMSTSLNQLDIGNEQGIDQAERELANYRSQLRSFSSPILDQVRPDGFDQIQGRVSSFSNTIEGLRNRRQQESQRIEQFEDNLLSSVDDYRNQIGDLSIADADQIGSLQQSVEDQLRQANRFESPLDYDLSNELDEVRGISSQIQDLQQQREAEQQRIEQAQQRFANTAGAVQQAASTADPYSAAGIQAIGDQLSNARTGIETFDSPLSTDFSSTQDKIAQADAALASLRERRQSGINDIASQIPQATQGLGDIALSNENAYRDRLSQLDNVQNDLSQYSGGRVNDVRTQIDDARSQVDGRLQELADYREGLRQQAQELATQIEDSNYYAAGDLTDDQQSVEALRSEADLYNAQQAMSEVDAVLQQLNNERQRLEADAEAVAARERAAQERIASNLGPGNVPQFNNFAAANPISESEFVRRFLSPEEGDEEDEQRQSIANRGFSSSLGVIRAR